MEPSGMNHSSSSAKLFRRLAPAIVAALLGACSVDPQPIDDTEPLIDVPAGFPEQVYPADNQPTSERVALGKRLFFDTRMSNGNDVSCATCHEPAKAFTDGVPASFGTFRRAGTRNAPSLANVGYLPYLMREGGVPTLEMQILVPIQEHAEFDLEAPALVARLALDSSIQQMSRAAYGRPLDIWVITRSIASFERTLVSGRSRVDEGRLTEAERRGRQVFTRSNCGTCHGGSLYTDHRFACNGLLETYTDKGRARLTNRASDEAVFRVPSLRNVGRTAPYLHNGSIGTLREVIERYNLGGFQHPNKDTAIVQLGLTALECADLEAFLLALTDDRFTTNPRFRP
jgi:cytochrome c peroxidase